MENVKNETNGVTVVSFNYDRFFSSLKSRLVVNLNYNSQTADELSKRIADIFNEAISKELV